MVLQQETLVPIWGSAKSNENIEISTSWGEKVSTKATSSGEWQVSLNTPSGGFDTHDITINTSSEELKINEILIGEVWLASGQSNMEMTFNYCCNTTDYSVNEISKANNNYIRMFTVKKNVGKTPSKIVEGEWVLAKGKQITEFSAPAYFFAKKIHKNLNVPVGIIHASWGGSDAEAWISFEKLQSIESSLDPDNKSIKLVDGTTRQNYFFDLKNYDDFIKRASASEKWFSQFESKDLESVIYYMNQGPLGDYFSSEDHWDNLNTKDSRFIDPKFDSSQWETLQIPGSFTNIFGDNNFKGVILFKRVFNIDDLTLDYSLELGEVTDLDFTYINGNFIGSTTGKNSYKLKQYSIPKKHLVLGENQIVIRVVNQDKPGYFGSVNLNSSLGRKLSLNGKWNYRVSAEIYGQMNNYIWPYDAFYLYEKDDIDFDKRPPIVKFDGRTSKGGLFNGMIHPLIPYKIKGSIWYQGENNVQRHAEYEKVFTSLIQDWREKWGYDFPFYFVQISPFYNYGGKSPLLREAQRKSLKLNKTGMAVTLDIGEDYDIHPSNKHDVGYRLARLALANDYGKNIVSSGPLYQKHFIDENKMIVYFDSVGSGLELRTNNEFEIAGKDGVFLNATVIIVGKTIVASNPKISNPVKLRYAWRDLSSASLFNLEGLPASSFSTEK
tara:strand:- start:99 stop:2096 length:1998 start_codon:yes stop_codon:yes gene_type:complete